MPCNSDYLEQNDREAELQRTAKLYAYALKACGEKVPKEVKKAAADYYCRVDYVAELCTFIGDIRAIRNRDYEHVVYNAKDRTSRDLADWWEDHQKADRKRKRK